MCVCLAWVLTRKSSVLTDPEPKQYGAHLGSIQVKICFFTLGGWRERRTQRPCFARSEVCSDAGLMNFICSWSAMGPIEFTFGNCKCDRKMQRQKINRFGEERSTGCAKFL